MKRAEDRDVHISAEDRFLDYVDSAISERMQGGHADEARYGFVAQMANATPPVNRAFQQALRARILVELAKEERPVTAKGHMRAISFWRLSLVGALAAVLVSILGLVISLRLRVWEPGMGAHAPAVTPASQLASEDVDALVDRLNEDSTLRTVLVYPGDYAEMLVGRVQHEVVPLVLNSDLAPAAIQAALGAALPPSGLVDVVLVNQEVTAAAHQVRIALEQRLYRLYRLGEAEMLAEAEIETFGALERSQFAVGPEDAALEPVGALFEGGVELVAGGVLDDPQSGEPLRLAFDWRVTEPVDDSLVTFVHLICDQSRLIAQRDAVPGNGLFPVESWGPGELVRDQFALQLPMELPAGDCEIQVGIYSATTGQRYSLVEPEGGTYIVVRRFTIEE